MWFKRGLRSVIADYTTRKDIYPWYVKNQKHKADITATKYIEIIKKFNHLMFRAMIYDNMEFHMPGRLGSIRILKAPYKIKLKEDGSVDTRKLTVNYKKTKELWAKQYPGLTGEEIAKIPNKKIIFEYNEHTDRYRFYFIWSKVTSNVQNQHAYYVEIVRSAKTELAKALKEIPTLKDNFYSRY